MPLSAEGIRLPPRAPEIAVGLSSCPHGPMVPASATNDMLLFALHAGYPGPFVTRLVVLPRLATITAAVLLLTLRHDAGTDAKCARPKSLRTSEKRLRQS